MTDVILAIGVAAFIVYAGFQVAYLLSVRRTSERMTAFLDATEGNVNATLQSLTGALENLRKISGDVRAVTEEVRRISDGVSTLERNVRRSFDALRANLGSATRSNVAGLRAGVTTGVSALVKNLRKGRRDDHERGTGEH